MRKALFTEEQITYALKQIESGKPVGKVCRQIGVSEQSSYRWRRKLVLSVCRLGLRCQYEPPSR